MGIGQYAFPMVVSLGIFLTPTLGHARPIAGAQCGTELLFESLEAAAQPRAMARRGKAAECLKNMRPHYVDEKIYDDDEYKFRIHYTTDINDSRSVTESQVLQTAEVMRVVIDHETDLMGYRSPPEDIFDTSLYCDGPTFPGHGGNGYYDIYFEDIDGVYGYAYPTTLVENNGVTAASFLALSTWIFDWPGALEVTVAHEYFHAVQFNYDVYEYSYWLENTAVWMEEQVYDEVNDYANYLSYLYEAPEQTLEVGDIYKYSHGIWPMFLTEATDATLIQEIWEDLGNDKDPGALQGVKSHLDGIWDGGFTQAVLDFRGAIYDRSQFEEGEGWNVNLAMSDIISNYPTDDINDVLHTAGSYIEFRPDSTEDAQALNLCFEGEADTVVAKAFAVDSDGQVFEYAFEPAIYSGALRIEDFGGSIEKAVLVSTYAHVPAWNSESDIRGVKARYGYQATLGDVDCVIPEIESNTDGGSDLNGGGDQVVVGCGGCIAVEDSSTGIANAFLSGLMMSLALFMRRRRR